VLWFLWYPSSLEWLGLTTAGCCFFRNNEATYKNTYGALYNFYAANSGKLCPTDWHVPTNEQFTALITFLGGSSVAGGKMKESGYTHWYQPNTLGTNESGFTVCPQAGAFNQQIPEMYVCGEFWTSTPNLAIQVDIGYYLDYWYKAVYGENVNKKVGFSIRCLKDWSEPGAISPFSLSTPPILLLQLFSSVTGHTEKNLGRREKSALAGMLNFNLIGTGFFRFRQRELRMNISNSDISIANHKKSYINI